MKSLAVLLLSVLLIQATTGRPANDDDEYEKHEEHSITYSSSNKPVRSQTMQTIMRAPSFPMMSFDLNTPGRQSFSSLSSGGLGAFPSFNSFPSFPPFPSFGQSSTGFFGGLSGQRPGGFGQLSGFFKPGSAGNPGLGQAGAASSASSGSQGNMKPSITFTPTSPSSPSNSQVSAGSQSSASQNGQASEAEEQEPSILFNFD